MKQGLGKGYLRLFVRAAVFLLILYLVFTRVLFLGRVTGMEMYPSLKDGDLALGYRLEREYRTGDVIVYEARRGVTFRKSSGKRGRKYRRGDAVCAAGLPDRPGRQPGWRRSTSKTGKGKDYNNSQKKRPVREKSSK